MTGTIGTAAAAAAAVVAVAVAVAAALAAAVGVAAMSLMPSDDANPRAEWIHATRRS